MKTFLFDFDGTLVDSMPTFVSAMLRILDEHKIPYGDDIVKIITPLGIPGTAEYFIQMGLDRPKDDIIAMMKDYMQQGYFYEIQPKEYVVDALKYLKAHGAELNVLTASPHFTLDACLKRLELFDIFDNVWSCDDFGTTKADPEIYKMVADRLGKNVEEILFLDDNLGADQTAKKAGMMVCGVYDPTSEDYVRQIKDATDYYIYDFRELTAIFDKTEEGLIS